MNIGDIDEKKQTAAALFSNGRKYHIPKYQRAFAWSESNVEKFWSDIFSTGTSDDYFMGTIVLSHENGHMNVIDGQQRLTVISLFFKALYILAKENLPDSSSYPDKKIDKFLTDTEEDDEEEYQIMTLGRNNNDFYGQLLKAKSFADINILEPETVSNKRLLKVLRFFVDKLREESEVDEHLEKQRIAGYLKSVKQRVFVLEISVPNSTQASKLFEVLNNRGVDLTKADLIRNYLLSKAESQNLFEDVEKNWNDIESNVGLDNIEKFFRYSSLAVSEKKDLYERVTEFTELSSSKTSSEFFLEMSNIYKKVTSPEDWVEESDLSASLTKFNMLGVTQALSVLMIAYSKFEIDDFNKVVKHITNFTFRYSIIAGANPNKLESLYSELAYTLKNTASITVENIFEKINTLWIDDVEFSKKFHNKSFKSTKIPRYILWEFERTISTEEKDIVFEAVHLEHIMPKNCTKWLTADSLYSKEFHASNLNKIGNMILLSEKINTTIKNSIFSEKKNAYDASEINMVTFVKEKELWDLNSINENAERYISAALSIWSKVE